MGVKLGDRVYIHGFLIGYQVLAMLVVVLSEFILEGVAVGL